MDVWALVRASRLSVIRVSCLERCPSTRGQKSRLARRGGYPRHCACRLLLDLYRDADTAARPPRWFLNQTPAASLAVGASHDRVRREKRRRKTPDFLGLVQGNYLSLHRRNLPLQFVALQCLAEKRTSAIWSTWSWRPCGNAVPLLQRTFVQRSRRDTS